MNHITDKARFPFRLANAFFTALEARRPPEIHDASKLNFSIQIKVIEEHFPERLEVNLKVETTANQPLTLKIELVGLFDLVDGQPVPERGIIPDFINERALFQMWPYITQKMRNLSIEMAANPVNLPVPYSFSFASSDLPREEE